MTLRSTATLLFLLALLPGCNSVLKVKSTTGGGSSSAGNKETATGEDEQNPAETVNEENSSNPSPAPGPAPAPGKHPSPAGPVPAPGDPDPGPPVSGNFKINDGAAYTTVPSVALNFEDSANIGQFRAAPGEDCSTAIWSAVVDNISIAIPDVEGSVKICAQVKNKGGLETAPVIRSITYDKTGPALLLTDLPAHPTTTAGFSVTVSGDPDLASYRFLLDAAFDCSGSTWSAWIDPAAAISESGTVSAHNNLCIQGRDFAGNEGPVAQHPFDVYAATPPSGSRDLYSFGTAGRVTDETNDTDIIVDSVTDSSGAIISVGLTKAAGVNVPFMTRRLVNGSVDPDFDGDSTSSYFPGNGYIIFNPFAGTTEARFTSVALQPDGKILASGYWNGSGAREWLVARFNPGGTLDTAFNGTGYYRFLPVAGNTTGAQSVAVSGSGKIAVCGKTLNSRAAVAMLFPNGVLDPDFDGDSTYNGNTPYPGNGIASYHLGGGGSHVIEKCIFNADDDLIATGMKNYSGGSGDGSIFIMRIKSDGSLDTGFNGTGFNSLDPTTENDDAKGLAIQSDGKIVITGATGNSTVGYETIIARFEANGALDTATFNSPLGYIKSNTIATVAHEEFDAVVIRQPGDQIIVSGHSGHNALVAKVTGTGSYDTSFVGSADDPASAIPGIVRLNSGGLWPQMSGLSIWNGQIVIGGHVTISSEVSALYYRLWP